MQARFATVALLGFVLLAAAACSGGGDDAKIAELEAAIEANEEALEEAEKARKEAEDEAAEAEEKRKEAEEEAKKVEQAEKATEQAEKATEEAKKRAEEAERKAEQARKEAQKRIEEAETQVDVAVRAPNLIAAMTTNLSEQEADVTHERGKSLIFRPKGNYPNKITPPSISGWRSGGFSRQRGAVGNETAYLYTNIGAPGSRAFWKMHGDNVTYRAGDPLAKPSGLPSAGRSLLDPDGDEMDILESDRPAKRSLGGSYDGVSGKFECTGAACNIARAADADGGGLTLTEVWEFKPNSLTSGVQQPKDKVVPQFEI